VAEEIEARLRRLEDIQAIQQLFIDYGHYLDSGDFDAYAALFAQEGEVQLGPMGKAKGRDAIKALMAKSLDGLVGSSFHIISSPMISLKGDSASSEVMWTVVQRGEDGQPVVPMIGRHRDELVRDEDGRWRFLLRRGFVDIPSKMP
jgi:uncharacterized protein (TIGR02246 family)